MVFANDRRRRWRDGLGAVLAGGFMAATLDFFAAMLIYHGTANGVAKAIARGWYGEGAKAGGTTIEVVGMASHWGILLAAAAIFALASLRFPALRREAWITGPLYGICIYLVMHFVTPRTGGCLSGSGRRRFRECAEPRSRSQQSFIF